MTDADYQQALNWLFTQVPSYQNIGEKAYKPGLNNIRKLCEFFGNPQRGKAFVHIAGTNGKGSTSSLIASALQEQGYKTGLYTSPHLIDFRERIRINGEKCSRNFVYGFIRKLRDLPADITPSFFEFTTVMAFEWFRQQQVDIAVIEVGLGGRLDATNIIEPLVTAITNVSLDHQTILGDTVEKIAAEKAGIIKKGIPVICGDTDGRVQKIIAETAATLGAPYENATLHQNVLPSDLAGDYQVHNIRVAYAVLQALARQNFPVVQENIKRGFLHVQRNTGFIGRWFIFSRNPLTICDTAHNEAGLREVFAQLATLQQPKHLVLGFAEDKNLEKILPLLPKEAHCYFAKPGVLRGRTPETYENLLYTTKISYKIFSEIQEAYLAAKQKVRPGEMIFVGGSNFVVGEFLEKNLER